MQTLLTDIRGVCLSVCLSRGLNHGGTCSVHRMPCAWGHSVQPLSNAFGFSLKLSDAITNHTLVGNMSVTYTINSMVFGVISRLDPRFY